MTNSNLNLDIHKEYPKTVGRTEFWRQIKRTVNGKPVSEGDIQKIITAIQLNLFQNNLNNIHLLDLGCGNAALASRLFNSLNSYTGVDFSTYLIEIAIDFFNDPIVNAYIESDIISYLNEIDSNFGFTHVLCYGVMSYLPKDKISDFFNLLFHKLPNVKRVFIGNLPDSCKANDFFATRNITNYELDNNQSPIGVWWQTKELQMIAESCGWSTSVSKMPADFYAEKYRFDITLTR